VCGDRPLYGVQMDGNPDGDAGRNLERPAALVEAHVAVADQVVEYGYRLAPHRQPPELQRAALEQLGGEAAVKGAEQRRREDANAPGHAPALRVELLQDVEPALERDRIVGDLEGVVSAGPALERPEDAPHALSARRRQGAQVVGPRGGQSCEGGTAGNLERHSADLAQRLAQQRAHGVVAAQRLQVELVPTAERLALQQRNEGACDLLLLAGGYYRTEVLGADLVAFGLARAE
jgi:hypothetical protein